MKGQNFASQVLSRHTFRISRKKGSDFFDHRGTLIKVDYDYNCVISLSRNGFRTKSNRIEFDCARFCSIGSIMELTAK